MNWSEIILLVYACIVVANILFLIIAWGAYDIAFLELVAILWCPFMLIVFLVVHLQTKAEIKHKEKKAGSK